MATDAQALTFNAPCPEELSRILPGYHVDSLIAVGGMGAVYYATQISLDRPVAIKALPTELGQDPNYRAQFETEAKAMARLNHPNLVGVYDFGDVDGILYIVMELVDGNSLYHASHETAIDPSEAIRVVKGICLGLHHAHENGVLHRDIKPSNILLDANAQPKIADFGLAQPMKKGRAGKDEEVFGTPHYTAPEVVNNLHAIDARADIFSTGVILHELLTGHVPAHDPRTASAIVQCDPRLDGVIRKATAPNPDLRYKTAAEMAEELDLITSTPPPRAMRTTQQPGRALSVSRPQLGPKPYASRPRPVYTAPTSSSGTGWIIILLLIAVIGAAILLLTRPAS